MKTNDVPKKQTQRFLKNFHGLSLIPLMSLIIPAISEVSSLDSVLRKV